MGLIPDGAIISQGPKYAYGNLFQIAHMEGGSRSALQSSDEDLLEPRPLQVNPRHKGEHNASTAPCFPSVQATAHNSVIRSSRSADHYGTDGMEQNRQT